MVGRHDVSVIHATVEHCACNRKFDLMDPSDVIHSKMPVIACVPSLKSLQYLHMPCLRNQELAAEQKLRTGVDDDSGNMSSVLRLCPPRQDVPLPLGSSSDLLGCALTQEF